MRPLVAALAVLAAGAVGCERSAPPAKETKMSQTPAPHVLRVEPASGRAGHLMVLLHGVGSSAEDLMPLARALAPAVPDAAVLVPGGFHPFDGGGAGRQWFSVRGVTEQNRPERVRQAGEEVSQWIDQALAERGLPPQRLILVGFSQGAIVSHWLALHRRPAPVAVVALSGRLAEEAPPRAGMTDAQVLLVHGAQDAVIPVALVDEAARGLEARGARVRVRVLPTLGHAVDGEVLREAQGFLREVTGAKR